jgi:hypothetical protein
MAKLPVTVTAVNPMKAGLYSVVVAFDDGTMGSYIVPETMATYDAVRISALVFAMLTDKPPTNLDKPHGKHTRYEPRP